MACQRSIADVTRRGSFARQMLIPSILFLIHLSIDPAMGRQQESFHLVITGPWSHGQHCADGRHLMQSSSSTPIVSASAAGSTPCGDVAIQHIVQ